MNEVKPQRDRLTQLEIGAAIEVHREMGPGLLESVDQKCLERELRRQSIACEPSARLPLVYKGETLDDYFVLDLCSPSQLVVELKAVTEIAPIHEAQLLTYVRLSKSHVGLLINFNVPVLKDGIKRMVL